MRKVSRGLIGYLAMIAAFILLIVLLSGGVNTVDRRIEYPQLLKYIDEGKVDRVSIREEAELFLRKADKAMYKEKKQKNK